MKEKHILDSWKEIAAYLKKSEKTCRRWEKSYGLPVRRLDDSSKAHVFAYKDEIDAWLKRTAGQDLFGLDEEAFSEREGQEGQSAIASIARALEPRQIRGYVSRASLRALKKPTVITCAVLVLVAVGLTIGWFFRRSARVRWARYEALPQIQVLFDDNDYSRAFELALEAEKYIPEDEILVSLLPKISSLISFQTDPADAVIYIKDYRNVQGAWQSFGRTPIEKQRIYRGYLRWKIEKEGYETAEGIADTSRELFEAIELKNKGRLLNRKEIAQVLKNSATSINRKLIRKSQIPPGMVFIQGGIYNRNAPLPVLLGDYLIDRYEVTNKQYKAFVDKDGYRTPEFWKHEFVREGRKLSWMEAISEFVDSTDWHGPATWKQGVYPEGEEDYPVRGISWYEAAAYAEFARKSLPSIYHWWYAAGLNEDICSRTIIYCPVLSNFSNVSPAAAGRFQGMSPFGAYDMAGNVREWCWNKTGKMRAILGCSWKDHPSSFMDEGSGLPFNRSEVNGFRCVIYLTPERIPKMAWDPISNFIRQ